MMEDLFSLKGKVALVTGGARGLGRMIAQGVAAAGAKVYITSRAEAECIKAAEQLGAACIALPGDAGSPEGIIDIANRLRTADEKHIHILVNNAGRTWGAPIEKFPDKAWPGVMAVNVQAPFRLVQELLPELSAAATKDDPARVINIGSVAGAKINNLNAYSYVASKAAIHQLSKQLAADLMSHHINVNTVQPGYFPTSMTAHLRDDPDKGLERQIPMRRLGTAEDISGAVIFLASRAGAYITGIDLPVDGGIVGCS